jgi:putative transposase
MTTGVGSFETVQGTEGGPTPVNKRVSPTERIRAEIDQLFASTERPLTEILEDVGRLSVRLLMQSAVEAEVDAFLSRARYERRGEDDPAGHRNGFQPPSAVKSTMGAVTLQRPKLRDTDERFCSQLFGDGVTRTNAIEALVISGWVRGLSDRDIEAALGEVLGPEAALSRSTVSRICQAIREEFGTWSRRPLDDVELDYLFLDASNFKMHPNSPAEPVLAAWGIAVDGKPLFIGLAPAGSESTDAWAGFLADLKARGLRPPLLGISDGAPGLIGAMETSFRQSLRQRCLIHRARNVLAKVPVGAQEEIKGAFWSIFDDISDAPGDKAVTEATRRARAFAARYRKLYPAAVSCLENDFASLTVHLRFPREHWKRIRHSNFIERSFGESRRRVKVIGRLPGETSCVSLVWAVLDRASKGWRGFPQTSESTRLLQDLRRQLLEPPRQLRGRTRKTTKVKTVTAAA